MVVPALIGVAVVLFVIFVHSIKTGGIGEWWL